MNALDILMYGHRTLLQSIDGIDDWETPGVTTHWSAKDVLAHMASYERFLEEALLELEGRGPTPVLDAMRNDAGGFNESQVSARRGLSAEAVRREYEEAHARVIERVKALSPARLRQPGTIPWYGPDYSLDDLIVYANYAHKREHGAQLRAFKLRHAAARSGS